MIPGYHRWATLCQKVKKSWVSASFCILALLQLAQDLKSAIRKICVPISLKKQEWLAAQLLLQIPYVPSGKSPPAAQFFSNQLTILWMFRLRRILRGICITLCKNAEKTACGAALFPFWRGFAQKHAECGGNLGNLLGLLVLVSEMQGILRNY